MYIYIHMYIYRYIIQINFASNFLLSESGRKEVSFAVYLKYNLSIFSPDISFPYYVCFFEAIGLASYNSGYPVFTENGCFPGRAQ